VLNLPHDTKEKTKLLKALHRLNNDSDYQTLTAFLANEQAKVDKKLRTADTDFLRVQGHAQILARLLELSTDAKDLLNNLPDQP